MNNAVTLLFLVPHVIAISFLFWGLTQVGQYFLKKEDSVGKEDGLRCGVENTSLGEENTDFKQNIIIFFLLAYDIGLIMVLPVSFNIFAVEPTNLLIFVTFICLIT